MNKEEQYIYDESAEISIGENPTWVVKMAEAFPAFHSKNFNWYFWGQLVSLIGTWLQTVAQGWLVLQLTNSAFLIGLVTALSTLPSLLFSLFGGVIVDRLSKKNILLFTQWSSMILAFILGILTVMKLITVWEIAVLAFLLGIINALDIPARQAFIVELVDKEGIASAIALNAGAFNAARVVGPAVAGFLIAIIGTGGAFILNAVSYIAAIISLIYITSKFTPAKEHPHPLKAINDGLKYSFSHPIIRTLLIFTGIVSIFGWSYTTIMPIIAQNTFHLGAAGLGYMYAASGLGALIATILVSALSKKVKPLVFIVGGNTLFAISLILFSLTNSIIIALPLLFLSGVGLLAEFATINTTIQHMISDNMRGRVMSIYSLMFLGLFPVGNFEIGYVAEKFGSSFAMILGAVITLLFGIFVYTRRHNIREAQKQYDTV